MAKKSRLYDVNKYEKNKKIRPDTLLKTLIASIQFLLILLAITGIAVHVFGENNLFSKAIDYVFSSANGLITLTAVALTVFFANKWLSAPNQDLKQSKGNALLYLMVSIGVFFLFRLITTNAF